MRDRIATVGFFFSVLALAACGDSTGAVDGSGLEARPPLDAPRPESRLADGALADRPPLDQPAWDSLPDRGLDQKPQDLVKGDGPVPIVSVPCSFATTGLTFTASSQWDPSFGPAKAMDKDDLSAWCGAAKAPTVTVKTSSGDEVFGDWWQVELPSAQTVGSLHMRSGFFGSAVKPAPSWKIRDFVWAYQTAGQGSSDPWIKIPSTEIYANRYQLIFRFGPLPQVKRMRLLIRPPDPEEVALFSNTYPCPCLREVTLCGAANARIPVKPWFYTVATFEAENTTSVVYQFHAINSAPSHKNLIKQALLDLTGKSFSDSEYPDLHDVIWFAEFHEKRIVSYDGSTIPGKVKVKGSATPLTLGCSGAGCLSAVGSAQQIPSWITQEPAPAGLLLTGNYLDYKNRSAELASGFYHFLHQANHPMLGTCGGHQMLAMAQLAGSHADFAKELFPHPDSPSQLVVSCTTLYDPAVYFDPVSKDTCTKTEHGGVNKLMASNTTGGVAIGNAMKESRQDLVLNLLDDLGQKHPTGFQAKFYHYDLVSQLGAFPASFHLIATYSTSAAPLGIDFHNFTLVQAIKVKGKPVYGTQFHWDASDNVNESGRVAQNFIAIAMSRAQSTTNPMLITTNNGSAAPLVDLDKATHWCAPAGGGVITLELAKVPSTPLTYLLAIAGQGPSGSNPPAQLSFQQSSDGSSWTQLSPGQITTRTIGGDPRTLVLFLGQTLGSTPYRFLKIQLGSGCLRELLPLDLATS